VRRAVPLLALFLFVAGSAHGATAPELKTARGKTTAEGTVRFTLRIDASIGGQAITSREAGTVSFVRRHAHLYKLVPNAPVPQELILIGPITYTNANVQAALADPSVKPWTKLDTRRLTARQRKQYPDELAHVRALAFLADGVTSSKRLATTTVNGATMTRFRGRVDPARIEADAGIRKALANDYVAQPFPADFWVDRSGRLRRVTVAYKTANGTVITIDGRFSKFGIEVDLKLPAKRLIEDISP
jgi:hypothetical protein